MAYCHATIILHSVYDFISQSTSTRYFLSIWQNFTCQSCSKSPKSCPLTLLYMSNTFFLYDFKVTISFTVINFIERWSITITNICIVANFSKFLSVRFGLRLVSPEGPPWLALRGEKIFWKFKPLEARKTLSSVKNLKLSESY